MPRRHRTAALGGTFDRLHVGHHALLAAAFRSADRVGIGVTTDRFLRSMAKPHPEEVHRYDSRRRALLHHLRATFPGRSYWVVPLDDPFGSSVGPGVDLLVVSEETLRGAEAVNRERRRRRLRPLRLVVVPVVRAADLRPVSSRRIRAGDIDRAGRRRTPVRIGVAAPAGFLGPLEVALVRRLRGCPTVFSPRTYPQAHGGAVAGNRAGEAAKACLAPGGDYGIALVPGGDRRDPATLAGWDPEGKVGAVRGTLGSSLSLDRLVGALFRSRRPGRPGR